MTCCKTKDKKRMCRVMCAHLIGGVAILAGVTALVMWLWNLLVPAIIGWKAVTYWQALGLLVLTNLLICPVRGHGCHGHHGHHHGGHCHEACDTEEQPTQEA